MRLTLARTRSPSTEGKPSRSRATTATETSPLRKTIARAVSSPRFSLAGFGSHAPGDRQERIGRDRPRRGADLDLGRCGAERQKRGEGRKRDQEAS